MIKDETALLQRVGEFQLDQISEFRSKDHAKRSFKSPALDGLNTHFHYFLHDSMNAYKQQLFEWRPLHSVGNAVAKFQHEMKSIVPAEP